MQLHKKTTVLISQKMALVKQYSSSVMQTIRKRSATSNTKLIQNYQTNIGT